jgi:hypothetical protein
MLPTALVQPAMGAAQCHFPRSSQRLPRVRAILSILLVLTRLCRSHRLYRPRLRSCPLCSPSSAFATRMCNSVTSTVSVGVAQCALGESSATGVELAAAAASCHAVNSPHTAYFAAARQYLRHLRYTRVPPLARCIRRLTRLRLPACTGSRVHAVPFVLSVPSRRRAVPDGHRHVRLDQGASDGRDRAHQAVHGAHVLRLSYAALASCSLI